MTRRKLGNAFAAALAFAALALSGCAEVKTFPPLDKSKAAEECAVLVIPANVKVKNIDGAKRGWIRSWNPRIVVGPKAATLLVPSGTHTITFDYTNSITGWHSRNMEYTATMAPGKMYMITYTRDNAVKKGTVSSAINVAASVIATITKSILPDWLDLSRKIPVKYGLAEIDQAEFDKYLAEEKGNAITILAIAIGLLWIAIVWGLGVLVNRAFMGKFAHNHGIIALIIAIGLIGVGIIVVDNNSTGGGALIPYLIATILISIGISLWLSGGEDANKRGVEKHNNKDYNGAIPEFNAAVKAAPYNAEYIYNRGLAKLYSSDYNGAVSDFDAAIKLSPKNAEYISYRGNAYYLLEDWEKAIADCNEALRLEPNNEDYKERLAMCLNWRGITHASSKDWGKAIADFIEAVRLDPKNETYKQNLDNVRAQLSSPPSGTTTT